jgi:hypothetical protein
MQKLNFFFRRPWIMLGAMILMGVSLFAQEQKAPETPPAIPRNFVTVDFVPLVKGFIATDHDDDTFIFGLGAVYERYILPHYSVGLRMDLYAGEYSDIEGAYFGMDVHGRWYPLSADLAKLFLDVGLGFNTLNLKDYEDAEFSGLTLGLKAGWKHFFNRMIFAEPSLAYILAKSSPVMPITPVGWQIGLSIGVAF